MRPAPPEDGRAGRSDGHRQSPRTRPARYVRSLSGPLEYECDTLAGAHTDADHAIAGLTFPEFRGDGEHVSSAGVAERMTERDGTAIWVKPVVGNRPARLRGELADDREDLRREGLVDLVDVDVVRLQPGTGDRLRDGERGGEPHDGGVDSDGRRRDDARDRLDAEF